MPLTRKEKSKACRGQGRVSKAPTPHRGIPPFPCPNHPTPSLGPGSFYRCSDRAESLWRSGVSKNLSVPASPVAGAQRAGTKGPRPGTCRTGNSTCRASARATKGQSLDQDKAQRGGGRSSRSDRPVPGHNGGSPAPKAPAKYPPPSPAGPGQGCSRAHAGAGRPLCPAPLPTSGRELYLSPAPRSLEPPPALRPRLLFMVLVAGRGSQ